MDCPPIGAGTFEIKNKEAIIRALQIGYRHLDLAEAYGNLKIVKEALYTAFKPISDGGLEIHRSSLFLTMKVFKISGKNHIASLLERVGVDYFDLLLYHSPTAHFGSQTTMEVNWQKLIIEKQNGNALHIGVSNFYKQHLTRLLKYCNDSDLDVPYANEIQINPYVMPEETIDFCKCWNIRLIAYCPLGFVFSKQLLGEANVQQIANETKCDPAQVVLSWLKKLGFYVIPRSSNEDHLRLNFNLHEIDSKYDVMLQYLKTDGDEVLSYMIDLSMDALLEEISWNNGQVEELKTGTEEEEQRCSSRRVFGLFPGGCSDF